MGYLSLWMLDRFNTGALVVKHKEIFLKAIIAFTGILPDPTKENTLEPNSHVLLDIRDKFFSYYTHPTRKALFKAAWKTLICEYEHDPHYRHILNWLLEELVEAVMDGKWTPRRSGHPADHWKEPRTEDGLKYGKFRGRRFARFIGK